MDRDMDVGYWTSEHGHSNVMFPSLNPIYCHSQSNGRLWQRQREEGEITILHRRMQTVSKGIPGARLLHLDRDAGQKTPACIFDPQDRAQEHRLEPGLKDSQS